MPPWGECYHGLLPGDLLQGESQNRRELERYWKERCSNAKAGLDVASANVQSLANSQSGSDGGSAYRSAIRSETAALVEYSRVLRIYTDLAVHGKEPDGEDERKAGSAK